MSERANNQEPPMKRFKVNVKSIKSPKKRKNPDISRTPQRSPSPDGLHTTPKLPKKLDMRLVDGYNVRRTPEGDAAFRADFAYLCDDFAPEGHGGAAVFDTVNQAKQNNANLLCDIGTRGE